MLQILLGFLNGLIDDIDFLYSLFINWYISYLILFSYIIMCFIFFILFEFILLERSLLLFLIYKDASYLLLFIRLLYRRLRRRWFFIRSISVNLIDLIISKFMIVVLTYITHFCMIMILLFLFI